MTVYIQLKVCPTDTEMLSKKIQGKTLLLTVGFAGGCGGVLVCFFGCLVF